MAFIDSNHVDFHGTEFLLEDIRIQPLRRDIEEFIVTENTILECNEYLLPGHARINGYGFNSSLPEVLHLIFHQGDKWSYNNTQTVFGKGRNLKSNGFPATRRHEAQCIPSFTDTFYDLLLYATERVISPVLFEYFVVKHLFS